MARMQPIKLPRTLPVVLSPQEVARLIAAALNVKHQAALHVTYGAALRASDVIGLKVTDVDSQRMTSASSRCCWATRDWRRHRSIPTSRPTCCTRCSARWRHCRHPEVPVVGRPSLEAADVVRQHGAAWRAGQGGHLSLAQSLSLVIPEKDDHPHSGERSCRCAPAAAARSMG
jgi:hypothetical protein